MKGISDPERYLTELGTQQALSTGHRLAELNLPLTYLVSSTMTRAQQTSGLIRQSLPENLEVKLDDPLLCEGFLILIHIHFFRTHIEEFEFENQPCLRIEEFRM